jgi:DNA-binding transcriptional regulator PaaX
MARKFNQKTLEILETLNNSRKTMSSKELFKLHGLGMPYKDFYNLLFRLSDLGLAKKEKIPGGLNVNITKDGEKLFMRHRPTKDGVWKLVIFDIPEKQKKIRQILRAKLTALHFKKWQNSIWITPYALDEEIEEEMKMLADKFFVRLIKVKEINKTDDLEKLFPD